MLKNYERRPITSDLKLRPFVYNGIYDEHGDTLKAIAKYSKENDPILIWGSESSLYFLSNRRSPTRYFYQYPLFTKNYADSSKTSELIDEIKNDKPKVIIDASSSTIDAEVKDTAIVPPINSQRRGEWFEKNKYFLNLNYLNDFFNLIDNDYLLITSTYNDNWDIYVLSDKKK